MPRPQVQLQWQPVQDLFWIKAFLWNKALFWNKAIWRYKTQTFAFAQLSAHMSKLNVSAGSRNCDYECTNGGGCKVTYVGPPRAGRTQVEFQRKACLPSSINHLHTKISSFHALKFTDFILAKNSRVPVSLVTLAAAAAGPQESARIANMLSTASKSP